MAGAAPVSERAQLNIDLTLAAAFTFERRHDPSFAGRAWRQVFGVGVLG